MYSPLCHTMVHASLEKEFKYCRKFMDNKDVWKLMTVCVCVIEMYRCQISEILGCGCRCRYHVGCMLCGCRGQFLLKRGCGCGCQNMTSADADVIRILALHYSISYNTNVCQMIPALPSAICFP